MKDRVFQSLCDNYLYDGKITKSFIHDIIFWKDVQKLAACF